MSCAPSPEWLAQHLPLYSMSLSAVTQASSDPWGSNVAPVTTSAPSDPWAADVSAVAADSLSSDPWGGSATHTTNGTGKCGLLTVLEDVASILVSVRVKPVGRYSLFLYGVCRSQCLSVHMFL